MGLDSNVIADLKARPLVTAEQIIRFRTEVLEIILKQEVEIERLRGEVGALAQRQMGGVSVIDLNKLPPLPEGWHYERSSLPGGQVVHAAWPGHGAVSIDFKERIFASGWCVPYPARFGGKVYVGRNWRAELVADAVNSLCVVWAQIKEGVE